MNKTFGKPASRRRGSEKRRGAFLVLAFFTLVVVLGIVALSVDLGVVSLTKSRMQNAVDAAALAAAQEITAAVDDASEGAGSGEIEGQVQDANSIAVAAARAMAAKVAALNGVYVDPDNDVKFGKRVYNEDTEEYDIQWDVSPYNVVKVTARRNGDNTDDPDGKLKLFFAAAVGEGTVSLEASAIAFVEARDLVVVLDYSESMNDDSTFEESRIETMGQSAIEANLYDMWVAMGSPTWGNMGFTPDWVTIPGSAGADKLTVKWRSTAVDAVHWKTMTKAVLTFTNGSTQTINVNSKTATFAGTGSKAGKIIQKIKIYPASSGSSGSSETFDFYDDDTIRKGLGLTNVAYPYSSGSWSQYIEYCTSTDDDDNYYDGILDDIGYRNKFGVMTFLDFLMKYKAQYDETEDLWKTPHYPFHAMKEGCTVLTEFLAALEFGDHLGLVTYDTDHRVETTLNMDGYNINLGDEPITDDYEAINQIQRHKQAGHYASTTNIGGGLWDARQLLDTHGRYGARPTILLMTDGIANVVDGNFSLPGNWNWAELTDFDGDGDADYTTSNKYKQYAFYRAKEAIDKGITIHTMAVGVDADREFMGAIAKASGGIFIDVPWDADVAEVEAMCKEAFAKIAAHVPPPKLLRDPDAE